MDKYFIADWAVKNLIAAAIPFFKTSVDSWIIQPYFRTFADESCGLNSNLLTVTSIFFLSSFVFLSIFLMYGTIKPIV